MRAALLGLVAVVVSGCTFGVTTCESSSECGDGTCVEGFCVAADAGSGGGSGGGMGGGVGGGGGADSGMGGGTDGGSDAGTGGGDAGSSTEYCDAGLACRPWQECVPTESGGDCADAGYGLRWVSPAANEAFNTGSVSAELSFTMPDGGTVLTASIPVTNASADFIAAGDVYAGTLLLSGVDGTKTFTAGWPDAGGPSVSLSLERDTVAPMVEVVVEARPGSLGDADPGSASSWKLDEAALVRVSVDGGRAAVAGDVTTSWAGSVMPATCAGACSGNCRCFAVAMAGAPLVGFRGQVNVTVDAISDSAGNVAATTTGDIEVTRFKWQRSLDLGSAASSVLPLVVAVDGTVVATLSDAPAGAPRLVAFAQDGGRLWSALDAGTMLAGPVASSAGLWVGANIPGQGGSQLRRVSLDQGMPAVDGECTSSTSNFAGDLALAFTDAGAEVPLAVRNGEVQGPASGNCRIRPLTAYPMSATARPSLVTANVSGGLEVFVASDEASQLWKARLDGTDFSARGDISVSNSVPRGLFLDGEGRAGGGGGALTGGSMFAVSASGALDAGTLTSTSANDASAPVLGATSLYFGTAFGNLVRLGYNPVSGAFTSGNNVAVWAGSLRARTPLLGEGERVFVVGDDGLLSARDQTSLSELWSFQLAASPTQITQLALDVHRGALGAKECGLPGVLYVLIRTNANATLHAVLVDSKGLDRTALWPKYQRDNGNTGNVDRPLSPWTCP